MSKTCAVSWVIAVLLATACRPVDHARGIGDFGGSETGGGADASGAASESTGSPLGSTSSETSGAPATGGFPGTPDVPEPDPPAPVGIPETCEEAALVASSIGCEFFSVELDNFSGDIVPFTIVAANVQLDATASVTLQQRGAAGWDAVEPAVSVSALDAHVFEPPPAQIDGSGVNPAAAWRLVSDVPIAAYQFNRYEAIYTSDASLLLPTTAWDTLHRVVVIEGRAPTGNGEAYFAAVSADDGTELEIVPTAALAGGPGVAATGVGNPLAMTLDTADVVQVAVVTGFEHPSGTRIDSGSTPIAVFAGTPCTALLLEGPSGACDHMEEQIPGVRLWGQSFVAARAPARSGLEDAEATLWQVVASEDETTVTFDAAEDVVGVPAAPVELDAGEEARFWTSGPVSEPGDLFIAADRPVLVANYMASGGELWEEFGVAGPGDPAMLFLPPVEQFLPRYVVLVPVGWERDVLTLVRAAGSEVRVDDAPVDDAIFHAVGSEHEVGRLEIDDGVHRVEGDDPLAVTVAGYRLADSYYYPGGLGTTVINPEPEG